MVYLRNAYCKLCTVCTCCEHPQPVVSKWFKYRRSQPLSIQVYRNRAWASENIDATRQRTYVLNNLKPATLDTHFIVARVPRRRPHSANFARRGLFLDSVLALLRRYGTSKFWML